MSDSPAVINYGSDGVGGYEEKVGQKTKAKSLPVTLASDEDTLPVSASSLPLPSGAATEAKQDTGNTSLGNIDTKLPASVGQKAMAASLPVVVASDQSAVPISAVSLPLPSGAATSANQTTGNSSLSSIDTKTPALGQAVMASSQPVAIASNQSAVPVSGPLTDTQLRATAVPVSASALPLPSGAATESTLAAQSAKLPASLGQKAMAASMSVAIASDQGSIPVTGSFAAGVIENPAATEGDITTQYGYVARAIEGYSSCSLILSGTWTGTVVIQGSSDDGVTWFTGAFIAPPPVAYPLPELKVYVSANGSYQCIVLGATTNVRVMAVTAVTGTIHAYLAFGNNPPQCVSGFMGIQQNISASYYNNSVANLASGASFTGLAESTLGVAAIKVMVKADQPILVTVEQSYNGTDWDVSDSQSFLAGQGDGRIFQVIASFYRVIATNQGPSTTTYFRLYVSPTPVVEVLPRALTASGKLRLTSQTKNHVPSPFNEVDATSHRALVIDNKRNLCVRGQVLTDERGFRADFLGSTLYTDQSGTFYFINGSAVVTGSGTTFSLLAEDSYVKLSSHDDTYYAKIKEVLSDTHLVLNTVYGGATASGTGRMCRWMPSVGSGGTLSVTGSELLLASGTTSGTVVRVIRSADYPPFVINGYGRITQRIANQSAYFGVADGDFGSAQNQVFIVWDGTTNTTCKLQTSFGSADIETTVVTLPDAGVTSGSHFYQIEVNAARVTFFIDDVKVAEHRLHIPDPYAVMTTRIGIKNTDTAASTTTLAFNTFRFNNYNQVEITTGAKGDPISVKELRASKTTSSNVSAAVADTQLVAPNTNRLGCTIYNDSVATLYLKLGSGASATSFTIALRRYDYFEAPANYVGRINGYWSAATGAARVTELS